MDKAPPARQTRSRPMTIEAGPSYFSHDGDAQCVLSNLAASRPVRVAREGSLFCLQRTSLLEGAISLRTCPAALDAFVPRDNVRSGCGADLHQRIKALFLMKT